MGEGRSTAISEGFVSGNLKNVAAAPYEAVPRTYSVAGCRNKSFNSYWCDFLYGQNRVSPLYNSLGVSNIFSAKKGPKEISFGDRYEGVERVVHPRGCKIRGFTYDSGDINEKLLDDEI